MKNKETKKSLSTRLLLVIVGTTISSIFAEIYTNFKIITTIFNFFIWLKDTIVKFFSASISIPIWFFILILLVSVVVIVLILLSLLGKKESLPNAEDYTKDKFDGIVWNWRWHFNKYSKRYEIEGLVPFCPKCDCQLFLPYRELFKCPNCDFEYNDYPKSMVELELIIFQRARRIIFQRER